MPESTLKTGSILPSQPVPIALASHPHTQGTQSETVTVGLLTRTAGPGGPVAGDGSRRGGAAFVIRRDFSGNEERMSLGIAAGRIAVYASGKRTRDSVAYRTAYRDAVEQLCDGTRLATRFATYWMESK